MNATPQLVVADIDIGDDNDQKATSTKGLTGLWPPASQLGQIGSTISIKIFLSRFVQILS
jgi:hypothetical protein